MDPSTAVFRITFSHGLLSKDLQDRLGQTFFFPRQTTYLFGVSFQVLEPWMATSYGFNLDFFNI